MCAARCPPGSGSSAGASTALAFFSARSTSGRSCRVGCRTGCTTRSQAQRFVAVRQARTGAPARRRFPSRRGRPAALPTSACDTDLARRCDCISDWPVAATCCATVSAWRTAKTATEPSSKQHQAASSRAQDPLLARRAGALRAPSSAARGDAAPVLSTAASRPRSHRRVSSSCRHRARAPRRVARARPLPRPSARFRCCPATGVATLSPPSSPTWLPPCASRNFLNLSAIELTVGPSGCKRAWLAAQAPMLRNWGCCDSACRLISCQ